MMMIVVTEHEYAVSRCQLEEGNYAVERHATVLVLDDEGKVNAAPLPMCVIVGPPGLSIEVGRIPPECDVDPECN